MKKTFAILGVVFALDTVGHVVGHPALFNGAGMLVLVWAIWKL